MAKNKSLTVRPHVKGSPIFRWEDVPAGHKTKTQWLKVGYRLRVGAVPSMWVTVKGDRREYAVFAPDMVYTRYIQKSLDGGDDAANG